jgi:hypothetical protein
MRRRAAQRRHRQQQLDEVLIHGLRCRLQDKLTVGAGGKGGGSGRANRRAAEVDEARSRALGPHCNRRDGRRHNTHNVLAAHVVQHLHGNLAVGVAAELHAAQRRVQLVCDLLAQLLVGAAACRGRRRAAGEAVAAAHSERRAARRRLRATTPARTHAAHTARNTRTKKQHVVQPRQPGRRAHAQRALKQRAVAVARVAQPRARVRMRRRSAAVEPEAKRSGGGLREHRRRKQTRAAARAQQRAAALPHRPR